MAIRFRNATPGTLICLIATALLAIVSFNTPLLKSLDFLSASYSEGTISLGTLGYCLTVSGTQTCVGPQVGYEFNPNTLFGVTAFDLPEAITKYLTYVLILHVVALAFAALATIIGIFAHSPTFPLLCLSIWMAGIASTFSFFALVFDLAMFYIARSRINSVSGASAEIGKSVWITLAAWALLAVSGCFFGIGNCCGGCRNEREGGDPKRSRYDRARSEGEEEDYKMRMMAIDNERARKQKQAEQGLPSFQELVPLKDDGEDKYLYENNQTAALPQQQQQRIMPGGLRRDGSVLQGVGVGYGRRNNATPSNDPYATAAGGVNGYPGGWAQPQGGYHGIQPPAPVARRLSDVTSAGDFVGVGAGGAGVERTQPQGYGGAGGPGGGYYGEHQYDERAGATGYGSDQGHYGGANGSANDQHYYNNNDPYQQHNQPQQGYNDPYGQQPQQTNGYNDPYRTGSAQPYDNQYGTATTMSMPNPNPVPQSSRSPPQGGYDYSGGASSESYDPGPRISNADPYDGYDDGLGAIGMAVTQGNAGRHERDYTGQTFGAGGSGGIGGGYDDAQLQPQHHAGSSTAYPPQSSGGVHAPRPQHLVQPSANDLLRSPPASNVGVGYGYEEQLGLSPDDGISSANRPPSYSAGNYAVQDGRPEKSSYR
ncbi:hypothetical protein CI109_103439 [Kwoniella shandongensis]|uniref:Uncharacterized protein n=1 Tax=Kwoniella shandongensis TaxID=1734106 RepID=A0A5M6BWG9_9TREE|nr:uncharacterized protein CI109_004519 [Kwoniella shandongensis]KAA5527226.1 hypothetical protein CI109_004519 [Kwoniella shandongensis]